MPKKTKAIKKTDIKAKKPWLKKAMLSKYNVAVREVYKTILIICEGQTEKLYFESFPVLSLTVKAVDLHGQSKTKLIESTESIVDGSELKYDEIWCVFDMDVKHGAKEFSDFDNSIIKGEGLGYKIAYSNDSFELWFYLHFNYTEERNLRGFYYDFLSRQWDMNYIKYGKTYSFCEKIYNKLATDENASQAQAISHAEKLYESQKNMIYHQQNPITLVYKLVKYLNTNLRN